MRAVDTNLGRASVEVDDAGLATAVTWEKPESDVLPSDTNYYTVTVSKLAWPAVATANVVSKTSKTTGGEAIPGSAPD